MGMTEALLTLLTWRLAVSSVSFSVSNGEEKGSFTSLEQAFSGTAALGEVEMYLLPSNKPFPVSLSVVISKSLYVRGEGQSVQLGDTLSVATTGLLNISNATLLLSGTSRATRVFDVRGKLVLANCSVLGLRVPLIWLYGIAHLFHMDIAQSSTRVILLKSGQAVLNLTSVSTSRLAASLVALDVVELPQTPFTITVTDSQFEDNAAPPVFFLYNVPGAIRIVNSSFARNQGLALDSKGFGRKLLIQSCLFRDNNNAVAVLFSHSQAEFHVANCTFINNFEVAFHIWTFAGWFVFEDCTIRQERGAGVIYLFNEGETAACQAIIRNSHISDISTTVELFHQSAVITTAHCTAHISNLTIANVSLIGPSNVFLALFAELWLSNITLVDSGTNGCVLNAHFCTLYLSDLDVDNYYSGFALYFFGGGSSARINNIRITRGMAKSANFQTVTSVFLYKTLHFAFFASDLKAQNVSISDTLMLMGPSFSLVFSNYSINNIAISHMSIGSVLLSSLSFGSISDIYIDRVIEDMPTFQAGSSAIEISGVVFTNSQLIEKSCILGFGKTQATIHNFTLTNSSFPAIFITSRSTIAATNLVVEGCNVSWSTCNIVWSQVHIQGFKLRNSDIRRFSVTSANLTMEHSEFASLISQDFLLEIGHSNVFFLGVSWGNISTAAALAQIAESSSVVLEKCEFEGLRTVQEPGFLLSESVLNVSNTVFRNFNFGLIQAVTSNITLLSSIFAEGKNPVQWLRSELAYGGVLSCTDCPMVTIKDSKFANVSAKIGGAVVAKRLKSIEKLRLVVEKSSFVGCRAAQAGALFIQNVSFTIDNSMFAANTAEQNGGGIYAAIKSAHIGIVSNSVFQGNSALEGGGIMWSNAPISFTNVSFRSNSAEYGADVASYGVALSSHLTSLTGNESSGYPLTLIFELQDHYGQRVAQSSFKYLTLQSTPTGTVPKNRGAVLHKGLFVFTGVVILAPPGLTAVIEAVLSDSQGDFALTMIGSVSLPFRNCTPGEIGHSDRCEYCPPGYVSFSPSDPYCYICPAHIICSGGNSRLVDSHYWSNASDSVTVQLCPLPDKCAGGANSTCTEGFTGIFCTQCAEEYTRISGTDCAGCSLILVILQLCSVLLVIWLQSWVILRYAVYYPDSHKLYVIKVLIHYLQYLSILGYLGVSYSRVLTWGLHVVNYMSSFLVPDLPLGCLDVYNSLQFKAIIGSLILPVLMLGYSGICYLSRGNWKRNMLILSTSALFHTSFISIITSIPLLTCQAVNSVEYLFLDMETHCWEKAHNLVVYLLVLPSLLLNVGGTIAATLLFRFSRPQLFADYFPLWGVGYNNAQLWDVPLSLAKYLFAGAMIAGLKSSALLQVIYSLIILIVASLLNVTLQKQAYLSASHFFLSEASLLAVALTTGFLSYYMYYLPGYLHSEWFVNAMILALNGMFLGLCVWTVSGKRLNQAVVQECEGANTAPAPPNTPTTLIDGQSSSN